MAVVEKIETLYNGSISVHLKDNRCHVEQGTQYAIANNFADHIPECYSGFCSTKIEAVYKTVVQFINWFENENKI